MALSNSTLTRLPIAILREYTTSFVSYPAELIEFAERNKIPLIPISSMRGQALALMAQPEIRGNKYVDRDLAVQFFEMIGMQTKDAIQQFNKPTGFARIKERGKYCLKFPFEADMTDILKRKDVSISGDRDEQINIIKEFHREMITDVPNDKWQIGHLDPTIPDSSESNLAYQPPIQGKFRDRFKFDRYFMKMWPTVKELCDRDNLGKYYIIEEQRVLYEFLKKKFDP